VVLKGISKQSYKIVNVYSTVAVGGVLNANPIVVGGKYQLWQ
jgi:hypothetical protein